MDEELEDPVSDSTYNLEHDSVRIFVYVQDLIEVSPMDYGERDLDIKLSLSKVPWKKKAIKRHRTKQINLEEGNRSVTVVNS